MTGSTEISLPRAGTMSVPAVRLTLDSPAESCRSEGSLPRNLWNHPFTGSDSPSRALKQTVAEADRHLSSSIAGSDGSRTGLFFYDSRQRPFSAGEARASDLTGPTRTRSVP